MFKETNLFGRYITNEMIAPLTKKLGKKVKFSVIGFSVENRPIYKLKMGNGKTKVLIWSQMHGNESTSTKALFDLFNVFETSNSFDDILSKCTLIVIPLLNPDGANNFTRANANAIDLNRDAQLLSQPESNILNSVFNAFKPDFCFNLHGQRTIFGAGDTGVSATLSFLSPSVNAERTVNTTRQIAMSIIVYMFNALKKDLPNGIGRYDDDFNINCVGDSFQSHNVPTVLFEAGHYPNDYNREKVRFYMFKAIVNGLRAIVNNYNFADFERYFEIPENKKNFYDVIIKNVKLQHNSKAIVDLGIQYKEQLINDDIKFIPIIAKIGDLSMYFGHKTFNASAQCISENSMLSEGGEIDFVLINNEKIALYP